MPVLLLRLFTWLLGSVGLSTASLLAWWQAKKAFVRTAFFAFAIAGGVIVSGLVVAAGLSLVSKVMALMSINPDTSIFAVANTIVPLTEICAQIFLLIGVRVAMLILSLSIYVARLGFNIVWSSMTIKS